MTDKSRSIIDLAEKLKARDSEIFEKAVMLRQIMSDIDMTPGEQPVYADLVSRVYDVMPSMDEPRFSMYDYADAIVNANKAVDPGKLLGIQNDSDFAAAMIWLAADKRETYEGRPHEQDMLGLDIFMNP